MPELDVICIGRSSVDLYGSQVGGRLEDMASFSKAVGGCPTNIAIGTARLGLKSGLITRVGDEHMGRFIREQCEREGVDVRGVITDPSRLTALVLLGIRDDKTFPLIFYRENCADAALDAEIAAAEARARETWGAVELSAIPGVAAWRVAYRGFGIKKTSYRSSVERLLKRVLAGDALPRVNALVDFYNTVSLDTALCLGCDDLDRVEGDLAFRFSRPGDSFVDMGAAEGEDPNDPPKDGEAVYADAAKVLCRRWNWRQDARSAVSRDTRRVVLTAQSNGWGDVEAAGARLIEGARRLGGEARMAVAEKGRTVVEW